MGWDFQPLCCVIDFVQLLIYGTAGDDTRYGTEGNDTIYGWFRGGNANSPSGNDRLYGYDGNDKLYGGTGNDTLDGGDGNNFLSGDSGNDTLYGDTDNDTLNGGNGNDRVYGYDGNDKLYGGTGNDYLNGGDGNDTLDGGTGNDTVYGDEGNDTYIVNSTTDTMREYSNEGTDTVSSSISYKLGADLENLTLTGTSAITGTGNALSNKLTGNQANNTLKGLAGDDTLLGNAGKDILTGGAGADTFAFDSKTEGLDTITDFAVVDTISVSKAGFGGGLTLGDPITPAQFKLGSRAGDASDRFIYNRNTGALFFDFDGTGDTEQVQFTTLTNKPLLTYADIVVV